MTNDLGSIEVLVSVDMVAVMVGIDHVTVRFVGDDTDRLNERVCVHRRRQGVDDHHIFVADDHAGIRDGGVVPAQTARLDIRVDIWRNLPQFALPGRGLWMPRVRSRWNRANTANLCVHNGARTESTSQDGPGAQPGARDTS